jgi:hypothetical protein
MLLEQIESLLDGIQGCTFAAMDTETRNGGVVTLTTGTQVLLATNKNSSAYENMVKRRLAALGKDPNDFILDDLRWGTRKPGTPLISNCGVWYLQSIILKPGVSRHYLGRRELTQDEARYFLPKSRTSQGLPEGKEVMVRTYALESIKALRLMSETVIAA